MSNPLKLPPFNRLRQDRDLLKVHQLWLVCETLAKMELQAQRRRDLEVDRLLNMLYRELQEGQRLLRLRPPL